MYHRKKHAINTQSKLVIFNKVSSNTVTLSVPLLFKNCYVVQVGPA